MTFRACNTCKYFEGSDQYGACTHPRNYFKFRRLNPITGSVLLERHRRYIDARNLRSAGWFWSVLMRTCGYHARWYVWKGEA